MGEMNRKEVMNELYDAILITFGAVGVSMVSKKSFGRKINNGRKSYVNIKISSCSWNKIYTR